MQLDMPEQDLGSWYYKMTTGYTCFPPAFHDVKMAWVAGLGKDRERSRVCTDVGPCRRQRRVAAAVDLLQNFGPLAAAEGPGAYQRREPFANRVTRHLRTKGCSGRVSSCAENRITV